MNKLIAALLDLIFPPKCPFCRSVLDRRPEGVCPVCEGTLPHTGSEQSRRLENGMLVLSPLHYAGTVRPAVRRYKFSAASGYAEDFGRRMARCLREEREGEVCLSDRLGQIDGCV
jgi:predicted amidophosphoribosyltransferase